MDDGYVCMIFSNPVPGKEREFDDWYEMHLNQVVTEVDGYVSGTRWTAEEIPGREIPEYAHVATYEISAPVEAALANLRTAAQAGLISKPDPAVVEFPFKSMIYRKL